MREPPAPVCPAAPVPLPVVVVPAGSFGAGLKVQAAKAATEAARNGNRTRRRGANIRASYQEKVRTDYRRPFNVCVLEIRAFQAQDAPWRVKSEPTRRQPAAALRRGKRDHLPRQPQGTSRARQSAPWWEAALGSRGIDLITVTCAGRAA